MRRGETLVELSLPNAQAAYQQAQATVRTAEAAYARARKQFDAPVEGSAQTVGVRPPRRREDGAAGRGGPGGDRLRVHRASGRFLRDGSLCHEHRDLFRTGRRERVGQPGSRRDRPPRGRTQQATRDRIAGEQALSQAQAQRDAALAASRQSLELAQAEFQQAQSGRKQGLIRAPISGTVLVLNARPGSDVGTDPRTPVVTIVDLDKLQLQGAVNPDQATLLKPGMAAVVNAKEVRNQPFDGTLTAVTTTTGAAPG